MADTILLGLDVGGSSIKAALVDVERGVCTTPLQFGADARALDARAAC